MPYLKRERATRLGSSHTISRKDKRHKRWARQRKELGYDTTELWSLTDTIASFIVPRLYAFKRLRAGHPACMKDKEWDAILGKMIRAFELVRRDNGMWFFTDAEWGEVDEGLDLFRRWYFSLWS